MAKNERFLTVDIGATAIKLGEFEIDGNGAVQMTAFAHREYEEELSDDNRINVIEGVLRQMLLEADIHTRRTLLSVSGQTALIRFGQIANFKNDRKQIRQLAEFEAKRNIPFAQDEISLDFQLIAGNENEEGMMDSLDVLSVVVKKDIVEQFIGAVREVGLLPILVDVAPVACYNAARANGLGEKGSVMIVSIGGRSTNLLFLEGNRFFARTIPIAGHTITQQIARKFSIGQPEAEELKRRHGFVAKTDDETGTEATSDVSKIVRNVMRRLYGEISRSISIYKAQQHGGDITKIYLTGGSTILTYCDQFFEEKFGLPVEYFNPLTCMMLNPSIDKQRLSEVAHTFSETIGLALRYTSTCPIEINLLPKEIAHQQSLVYKKPYFVASMVAILVMFFIIQESFKFSLGESNKQLDLYKTERAKFEPAYNEIKAAIGEADGALSQVEEVKTFLMQRAKWPLVIEEIFRAKPDNVWIDSITPIFGEVMPIEKTSIVEEESGAMSGDMFGMGMEMGMMSMDGGMGMDGMMGGAGLPSPTTIGGLSIIAHTISLYGNNVGRDPQLAAEPVYPFEVPEKSADEEGDETETAYDADGNEVEVAKKDDAHLDQSGNLLFLRNLKKSALFSDEEEFTATVSRQKSEMLENGSDFEIQLKFNLPLEAVPWSDAMNNEGGMGGRMGGMGGAMGGMGGGKGGALD
ncbi:MAG: type IV pilus assembly protein PilM [Lentisphaeria bacterium]|nr:type IV pilus assembly protein PilM [Lentisphaeria bacterium]